MEALVFLGLGILLYIISNRSRKASGKSRPGTFQQPSSKSAKKDQEFWDLMLDLDDEEEMDGL